MVGARDEKRSHVNFRKIIEEDHDVLHDKRNEISVNFIYEINLSHALTNVIVEFSDDVL